MADRIDAVIEDGSLRRLAHERSKETAPVLIEVAGPTKAVDIDLGRRGGATIGAPTHVTVEVADGNPPADASEEVTDILGRPPYYLRAARAFSAVATGAQLAALAASPLVQAIRPAQAVQMK
ncbi:MAG TPA: hypothetical protein VKD67_10420 [Acidimicrobiales bacterium]|nr:hypothetical protein [Acidimicrobiales bacterium]